MNPKLVRRQVAAFIVIAALVVGYILINYVGLGSLLRPSFTVHAHFADSGGVFVGAEVDNRGIRIGDVSKMTVTKAGVTIDLEIDNGTKISTDLHAAVTDRSALGEQFVQLTPAGEKGPFLHGGSVIDQSRTSIPIPTQTLLSDLDGFAASVPKQALRTDLSELGAAFSGLGPDLQTLIDSTTKLTTSALADIKNTIALLQESRVVLDTQVASGSDIDSFSTHLASLAADIRSLDPALALLFSSGIDASAQVTDLLDDTQQALPVLLNNLVTVTDVAAGKIPQIRKVLVTFPYALENGLTLLRYCDTIDVKTGKQSGCHYDAKTGLPVYSAHFGLQLAPTPLPCSQGYDTKKYLPNGNPLDGKGPKETASTPANDNAICTASPTSGTPNVRGFQNAQTGSASSESTSAAYYDPISGTVITADGSQAVVTNTSGATAPDGLSGILTMGGSLGAS